MNKKPFAKLYEFDDIGQVLAKVDDGDSGPELRFYFVPDGLGVCSVAVTFQADDQDDHWDKAEQAFDLVDEEKARTIVVEALNSIPASLVG